MPRPHKLSQSKQANKKQDFLIAVFKKLLKQAKLKLPEYQFNQFKGLAKKLLNALRHENIDEAEKLLTAMEGFIKSALERRSDTITEREKDYSKNSELVSLMLLYALTGHTKGRKKRSELTHPKPQKTKTKTADSLETITDQKQAVHDFLKQKMETFSENDAHPNHRRKKGFKP